MDLFCDGTLGHLHVIEKVRLDPRERVQQRNIEQICGCALVRKRPSR